MEESVVPGAGVASDRVGVGVTGPPDRHKTRPRDVCETTTIVTPGCLYVDPTGRV